MMANLLAEQHTHMCDARPANPLFAHNRNAERQDGISPYTLGT